MMLQIVWMHIGTATEVTQQHDGEMKEVTEGRGWCAVPCLFGNVGTPGCRHAYRLHVQQMKES
jgi:hypothetical protein